MKFRSGLLAGIAALLVYWRTAYPSINWWDSGQYSLAAYTLGVAGPPGSLFLTLLGWPIARLSPGESVAHALNLFAGVLAATTVVLVCAAALRALRLTSDSPGTPVRGAASLGAGLGALSFAFSATLWEYAVQFTPYVLTTVFTALILLVMMRWWETAHESDSWRYIALLGLLFGLDFSVHRTNALLMPAVLVWIAMRNPAALRRRQTWLAGFGSLFAGLSLHLLLIPIARTTSSPLFWNDPTNLSRFWSYISLERIGGGFLLGLLPRNSNIFTEQFADLFRAFGDNFLHLNRTAGVLGVLTGLVGLYGCTVLWKRDRAFGKAYIAVFLVQAFMTVVYFNIPADFFRSLDRHYLPVFVTFGVAIACGSSDLLGRAVRYYHDGSGLRAWAIGFVAALVPVAAFADQWRTHDASKRWFTADYARNALRALPPNAIYFTAGDNDTWPILYMQEVERLRRDVLLVNVSLTNAPEYMVGLQRRNPTFPLSITPAQTRAAVKEPWHDTVVVLPVSGSAADLAVPADSLPREIVLHPTPQYGKNMIPGEVILLDLVRTNAWKRPLTYAITASEGLAWLEPFARLDGVFWRIVPVERPSIDPDRLRASLAGNEYRGYADPSVIVDDVSRRLGAEYLRVFDALLEAEEKRGVDSARCRAAKAAMLQAIPPERVAVAAELSGKLRLRCEKRAS